jgi:ParB family chromosome partitioning protein
MTAKHKGLGRGLDALLGGSAKPRERDEDALAQLATGDLRPGKYQPRTRMDETSLAELADSIRVRGVIQPIIVRPVGDSKYEILAGERRWRAARLAGLERVPVVIREVPDEAALGIGLIENIQREDLNPIEEANGLARLIGEFKLTHDEVAKAIGRSRTGVTNLLRLLDLAPAVQDMVQDGRIDMGHARALLSLSKPRQAELAQQVADKGLSVRETERLVQAASAAPAAPRAAARALDADTRRLQEELCETLGATVTLKLRTGGKGSVVIDYSSLEELEGLLARFRGPDPA